MMQINFFIVWILFIPFLAQDVQENGSCSAETCEQKESAFMTPTEYDAKRAVVQAKLDEIVANITSLNEELENLKKQKDQAVYDEKLMKGELAKLDAMNDNLLESFKKLGGTNGLLSLKNFLKRGQKTLNVDSEEQLEQMFTKADENQDEKVEIEEFLSILTSIREQKITFKGERKQRIRANTRSESALKKISDKAVDALKAVYKKIDKGQDDKALEYGKKKMGEIEGCAAGDLELECAELVSQVAKMQYVAEVYDGLDDILDSLRDLLLVSDQNGGFLNMPVYNTLYRIWPMLYYKQAYEDLAILFEYQYSKQNLRMYNQVEAGKNSAHLHMCDGELAKALKTYTSLRSTLVQFSNNPDANNERASIERKILRIHRWENDDKAFQKFLKKVNKKNKSKWKSNYMPTSTFKSDKLHIPIFDIEKWPQIQTAATKLSGEGVFDGWQTLFDLVLPWDDSIDIDCLIDPNSDGEYLFIPMIQEKCTFSSKACKYLFKNLKKKEKLKAAPAAINFHLFNGPAKLRPWLGQEERPRLWMSLDSTKCFKVTVGEQEQEFHEPILTNEAFLTSLETTCDGHHGFLEIIFQGKVKKSSGKWQI